MYIKRLYFWYLVIILQWCFLPGPISAVDETWQAWSSCSATCGRGLRRRDLWQCTSEQCVTFAIKHQFEGCQESDCRGSDVVIWSAWTACPSACSPGWIESIGHVCPDPDCSSKTQVAQRHATCNLPGCAASYDMVGPFGNTAGGGPFTEELLSCTTCARITQINVRAGAVLDAVSFVYDTFNGGHHGGHGGLAFTVNLEPNEYIQLVKGVASFFWYFNRVVITGIEFETNLRTLKYGGPAQNPETFEAKPPNYPNAHLAYISGYATDAINALNFHFAN